MAWPTPSRDDRTAATLRPPHGLAGFDRRELRALAIAAVTGLALAAILALTITRMDAPTATAATALDERPVETIEVQSEPAEQQSSLRERFAAELSDLWRAMHEEEAQPVPTEDPPAPVEEVIDLDAEVIDLDLDEEPKVAAVPRALPKETPRKRASKPAARSEREPEKADKPPEAAQKAPTKRAGPSGHFDPDAARNAMFSAASRAAGCGTVDGPSGRAGVSVTFSPSGAVSSASVSPPFAGTATGGCIVAAFRAAATAPFKGSSVSLSKSVFVRAKKGSSEQ